MPDKPPQSHLVRSRLESNYEAHNNGYSLKSVKVVQASLLNIGVADACSIYSVKGTVKRVIKQKFCPEVSSFQDKFSELYQIIKK